MGIIAFILLGLLAGAIAKALLPGDDPGGFIVTAIVGVAGALLGGFLAGVLFDADPMDEFFDISTWVTAIIGSIVLLLIYRMIVDRRGVARSDLTRILTSIAGGALRFPAMLLLRERGYLAHVPTSDDHPDVAGSAAPGSSRARSTVGGRRVGHTRRTEASDRARRCD